MGAPLGGPPGLSQPLSLRLRHATHDQHAQIEANPRFARLMAPDLTRDEYRVLLARLFGHHAPAEAALGAAAQLLPAALGLPRRLRRTGLLAADLVALGMAAPRIAGLPRCQDHAIRSAAEAWGLLYVLEGATLGGQVIARHLALTLGLGPQDGAGALVPHGAETGALWRGFKQALDEAAEDPDFDSEATIEAARRAFGTLDAWVAGA